jgi:hypothetical protein
VRRAVGIAAVAILIFDVVWPLAYRALPARRDELAVGLTIVSLAIAFTAGLMIVRHASVRAATVAAGMLGALDATVGWAISLKLAPDLQDGPLAIQSVLSTIVAVVLFYAVLGFVGAVVGRRLRQAP